MARVNALLESFNAGEFSEKLTARLSFQKYPLAAATLKNVLPFIQGAFTRRPGSRFVAPTKDETKKGRLFEFEFNVEQAYIADAGDASLRFFRNQGQITVADTDAAITNGDFPSGITDWDDRSTGAGSIAHDATNDRLSLIPGGITSVDIGWAEQDVTVLVGNQGNPHVLKFQVIGAPGDKIELRIGTTTTGSEVVEDVEFLVGFHCYDFTPGATTFYIQFRNLGEFRNKTVQIDDVSLIDDAGVEIDTPYAEADLFSLQTAQSADVMYICWRSYPVYKLTRSSHLNWSLIEVDWIDGPYLAENLTDTTLMPSAATGLGINLTLSSTEGVNGGQGWLSTDIGRLVRCKKTTAWGYAVIVSITSPTVAVADIRVDFESTSAETTWRLGAWSSTTGYPSAITFYEQRLALAGTNDQPQTFWLSQSGDLENMRPDDGAGAVADDDALDFTMAARRVNVIRWLAGGLTLVIGTSGGEWQVKSEGPILKPTDVDVKRHTTRGSAQVQPVEIGHVVVFVQRAKRKLRDLTFDFDISGLRSRDLTILADHVGKSGFVDIAYQQEPQSTIWCVRNDGVLGVLTYEVDQQVVGWSRHILGGEFESGEAVVESVAVIPGNNAVGQVNDSSDRDEVWITVKRTINGVTRRYIEFLEGFYEGPRRDDFTSDEAFEAAGLTAQKDAFYVDSGLTYDDVPTMVVTGLDHLEGETVSILADGAVHPQKIVVSGQITLDYLSSKVQVGLPYTHTWRSLKLAFGAQAGTSAAQTKRVSEITLDLLDSLGGKFGPDENNLEDLIYREVGDSMDTAVPLFSGEKPVSFDGDWDTDARMMIQGSAPVPFTCLAVVIELTTNESL